MPFKKSYVSAISRLFSSAVFREMAKKGRSSTFARLCAEVRIREICETAATVADAFDEVYSILRKIGNRDEYVYKAALTRNVLLGKHSLNTASMLSEFRAGTSKADLVVLNGSATVYEIKSERDSLGRLARQIDDYQKVFPKVYVISSDSHLRGVLDTVPDEVGVMSLNRRYNLSTVRNAIDRMDLVCPQTVFESLRSAEAQMILQKLGVVVPDVPNTRLHRAMRDTYRHLQSKDLHVAMVETLKSTRDLAPLGNLVDRLPNSLHAAALSIRIRRSDHDRLVEAVRTPIGSAMNWA